ncbi:fluoride efflux transporter CrcB [Hoylesella marshii]|uniref:Fluoride-specific ion channel FluC n=1 Tax=Hoylesella marshii DSM 16973 = JCM 13450 TaxID=862515 RepID=E0NT03_9BACT|nr:fluoride efflux transporter CrcB [Hoylesella marshii]EFM01742.1 protein CrcB [Hoylesella marshii DSM 16973 = JCM 13450]
MIRTAFFIALGGALGSMARYFLSKLLQTTTWIDFPFGTWAVNLLGCFLIGLLTEAAGHYILPNTDFKLFLTVGFCGGFTTFSTFTIELLSLLRTGNVLSAAFYAGSSVFLGLLAAYIGIQVVRFFS